MATQVPVPQVGMAMCGPAVLEFPDFCLLKVSAVNLAFFMLQPIIEGAGLQAEHAQSLLIDEGRYLC